MLLSILFMLFNENTVFSYINPFGCGSVAILRHKFKDSVKTHDANLGNKFLRLTKSSKTPKTCPFFTKMSSFSNNYQAHLRLVSGTASTTATVPSIGQITFRYFDFG